MNLKNNLKKLSQGELIGLLMELYRKNNENKELLEFKFNAVDETEILKKYKQQVINEFFPARGFGKLRYSKMREAIKKFKDVSRNPALLADLMMAYVENGVRYTDEYGDIDEYFYNAMENMYDNALKYLQKNKLLDSFKGRAKAVVEDTQEMGWGFPDNLGEIYDQYYARNGECR
jgi:hypothetical protein